MQSLQLYNACKYTKITENSKRQRKQAPAVLFARCPAWLCSARKTAATSPPGAKAAGMPAGGRCPEKRKPLSRKKGKRPWKKSSIPALGVRLPDTQFSVLSIQHPASSIQHPASSIQHPASSVRHSAFGIRHSVFGIRYPVFRHQYHYRHHSPDSGSKKVPCIDRKVPPGHRPLSSSLP